MSSADLTRAPRRGAGLVEPRFGPSPAGSTSTLKTFLVVVVIGGLAIGGGYLVGHGQVKVLMAIVLALGVALVALTPRVSAPLIGVFFLLAMNGLPVVNLG